jgi:organic radical activating enzyme
MARPPRRQVVRPNPLAFQQRTIAAVSSAVATENKEKADELQSKVTSLESDPFFVTIDGGGPVLEDTDIFDGGQADA